MKVDHNVELLAPAGSYEAFEAALGAGADAVYVGGPEFGARAYAHNFTQDELLSSVFIPFLNYEYETNKEDYRSNPLPAFFI